MNSGAHGNSNVQSHVQEESKLNSNINMNSGAHTLNDFEYITVIFNRSNVNVKFTNITTDFINSIHFTIEKRK